MKVSKIYLDMDGVLCNFERRYFERYNELPGSMRDRKDFNVHWDDFVETRQFETLDWWPGGQDLLTYVNFLHNEHGIEVEMLTSSGGQKHYKSVAEQKQVWLNSKGILFKANVVAGRKTKAEYAKSDTILIDDTPDVIQAFNAAGGIGVLHKEIGNTLLMLKSLVTEDIYTVI